MKIVVGLGNPGRKYERTRHNAGFLAIADLARRHGIDLNQEKNHAVLGKGMIASEKVLLVLPLTYMNESGRAVAAAVKESYSALPDLIVLHDELDLPPGTVRVKQGGGHGGHNGLRSLIQHLGSPDFIRVRVGIGRPAPGIETADHVLSPALGEEKRIFDQAIERASEAAFLILSEGAATAMNRLNQK